MCWALGGDALRVHPLARPRLELVEDLGRVVDLGRQPDQRLRELVAEARDQVAQRAQQARRGRHDHREGAHQLRDRVGVQRAGAAEGHERELARVVAALHADHAQRAGHVLVDDPQDAVGGLLEAEPHRVGDLLHRGLRRLDVERHLAADQVRREMAEHDVGVGHGRLGRRPGRRRRARARRPPTAGRRAARR